MSIQISFMTLAVIKYEINERYPGGVESFKHRYPFSQEDDYLVGITSMSSGDLRGLMAEIEKEIPDLSEISAVGDMMVGEVVGHHNIEFTFDHDDSFGPKHMDYKDYRYLNADQKHLCETEQQLRDEIREAGGVVRAIPTPSEAHTLIAGGRYFPVQRAVKICQEVCNQTGVGRQWLRRAMRVDFR